MYKFEENYREISNRENLMAFRGLLIISSIFIIMYLVALVMLVKPIQITEYNVMIFITFIRIVSVILAMFAVGSCILCYISTNKDEVFIVSLIYMIMGVDLLMGNIDNIRLIDSKLEVNSYAIISTSLMRIGILMVLVLPFNRIREITMSNKLKTSLMVISISIFVSIIVRVDPLAIFPDSNTSVMYYSMLLCSVYLVFALLFMIKSMENKDYIYLVLSISLLFLSIKALYSIAGTLIPSIYICLASLSATYISFFVLIGGIFAELAFSIKKNNHLENERKIFYNLVDDSKYSCIVIRDKNKKVRYANKTVKEYLFNRVKVRDTEVGKKIEKYVKELEPELIEKIDNRVKSKGVWKGNVYIKSKDITLSCFIEPIDTYDNDSGAVIFFTDISHSIKWQNSLIEYEKMKNHETIKNEFFANISHELRTPLNIFYSTVQLLDIKSKDVDVDFNEVYLNHKQCLKINCQRMLRLIDNIVDITKFDVGFTKPKFGNYDIVKIVEDITMSVVNYANLKDINITFDTGIEEHIMKCDVDMMERVMLNLLSNAIKFTDSKGNIFVDMYNDEEWVYINIRDNGIGIPTDMQNIIFERFVQSDRSLTRLNEGSGIGLSIVKSIIDIHEGAIYLQSDGKHGTEFNILLPNRVLENTKYHEQPSYKVDIQKIELELSDIYELY